MSKSLELSLDLGAKHDTDFDDGESKVNKGGARCAVCKCSLKSAELGQDGKPLDKGWMCHKARDEKKIAHSNVCKKCFDTLDCDYEGLY